MSAGLWLLKYNLRHQGRQPPGIEHADKWGEAMAIGYSGVTNVGENYWKNLVPAAGRKEIKVFATPNEERRKGEDWVDGILKTWNFGREVNNTNWSGQEMCERFMN